MDADVALGGGMHDLLADDEGWILTARRLRYEDVQEVLVPGDVGEDPELLGRVVGLHYGEAFRGPDAIPERGALHPREVEALGDVLQGRIGVGRATCDLAEELYVRIEPAALVVEVHPPTGVALQVGVP